MDIDQLLDKWAEIIKSYEAAANQAAEAEVNLESVMAKHIIAAKQEHGSTLAEKVAKGSDEVKAAKRNFLSAENKVKAQKAKMTWIDAAYTWERVKYSAEGKAARS